jgi:uncharacterized protein (TIGR02996 family)
MTEGALLRDWDDLAAHGAYADWLIEQGDPRGALVRCQLQLEDPTLDPRRRQDLRDQEQALLAQHQATWLADLGPAHRPRNYPPDVLSDPRAYPEVRWERGRVVGLRFGLLSLPHARQIAASPELRFVRELDVGIPNYMGPFRKTDLLPGFPFKRFRHIYGPKTSACYPLATSPHLGNVRKLTLGQRPPEWALAEAVDQFANYDDAPALVALLSRVPRLEHLCVAVGQRNPDFVELFSLAGPLPALRELELYYLDTSDVSRLFCAPSLDGVRRLTLHACLGAYRANARTFFNFAAGVAAPHLSSLECLRIYREARGDELVADLVNSPAFDRLRELAVVCSHLSDAGARTLIAARPRSALTALDVSFGVFSTEMLERLRLAYPFLVADSVRTPAEYKRHRRDNLVVRNPGEAASPCVPTAAPRESAPAADGSPDGAPSLPIDRTPETAPAAPRIITLTGLPAGADRVRRLQAQDNTLAVLVGDDRHTHLVVWLSLPGGAELRRVAVPVGDWAPDPTLSPDLNTLVYAERDGHQPQFVAEAPDGVRRTIPFPDWTGEGLPVACACISLGGGGVLRASMADGALFSWDLRGADLSLVDMIVEEYPPVVAMEHGPVPALGAEGYVIACQGALTYLRIGNRAVDPIYRGGEGEPVAAAVAPNGAQFAVAFEGLVRVWGTANPYRPPEHAALAVNGVRAVAYSPDSATLATVGADGRVRFWSGDMGAPRSVLEWDIGALSGVAFTGDGRTCVVGGEGGRLVVWGLADEPSLTPPTPPPLLPPPPPPRPRRARR